MPPRRDEASLRSRLTAAKLIAFRRADQGWERVKLGVLPVLEASATAAVAWAFAHYVLGHPQPFFAPVAAWICMGFTRDRDIRHIVELTVGVTLGVGLGFALQSIIGSGWWQIGAVLFLAALLGRFIDSGRLLTIQFGVQAIFIMGLPVLGDNPQFRWLDALVGGLLALVASIFLPHDVTRPVRAASAQLFREIGGVCSAVARGLRRMDRRVATGALVRGRATQKVIDAWYDTSMRADRLARISPGKRRYLPEIRRLRKSATYGDRAIRNARVIARRAEAMLAENTRPTQSERFLFSELADATDALAAVSRELQGACRRGWALDEARPLAVRAAQLLGPRAQGQVQAQAYVLLLRSLAVDLLQSTGLTQAQARELLPAMNTEEEA